MGMAASQARLLSITSRMADNELRAQLINNSKMRLATETSKASESYITALNSATMMISGHDKEGNNQYQPLTFNALTNYSSYNNQYGLVTANGQLLASESDTKKFKAADGDVNKFLAQYGLVYKSNYFTTETLKDIDKTPLGGSAENPLYSGKIYTPDELFEIYNGFKPDGTASTTHEGYDNLLNSPKYDEFNKEYIKFTSAKNAYEANITENMRKDILGNSTWTGLKSRITDTTPISDYKDIFAQVDGYINGLIASGKLDTTNNEKAKDFNELFKNSINSLKVNGDAASITSSKKINELNFGNQYKGTDGKAVSQFYAVKNGSSYEIHQRYANEDGIVTDLTGAKAGEVNGSNKDFTYFVDIKDGDGNPTGVQNKNVYNDLYKALSTGSGTVDLTRQVNQKEIKDYADSLIKFIEKNILSALNKTKFVADKNIKDSYTNTAESFARMLFGGTVKPSYTEDDLKSTEYSAKYYDSMSDVDWLINEGINIIGVDGKSDPNGYISTVKDIRIIDDLFEIYGEPKTSWIDENDTTKKENADAKARWYTNLFNRMSKGFKTIEDGLASSNQWMQYALESGLISMEQVDKSNNWTSTIYSNCSDITEVTDDLAVARAEAGYKKTTNDIENKDKRFDMELKNIDTEHNSLQTEYDSVKSVITKNIERSFKMYS